MRATRDGTCQGRRQGLNVTLDTAAGARCALSAAQLHDLRLLGV